MGYKWEEKNKILNTDFIDMQIISVDQNLAAKLPKKKKKMTLYKKDPIY